MRDEAWREEHRNHSGYIPASPVTLTPTYFQVFEECEAKLRLITDPTSLIIVDEADRLTMNGLEQLRSTFDDSGLGMVLIGMPGIEKRIARFPQFYSRIGFVHEFRPLDTLEMQTLLDRHWSPTGVTLPESPFTPEVVARLIRITGGNFRLLMRLLTQVERVLQVNDLDVISLEIVQAARDSRHRASLASTSYDRYSQNARQIPAHATVCPTALLRWRCTNDWTFGCVALADAEMKEVYDLVPNGTPIDIVP